MLRNVLMILTTGSLLLANAGTLLGTTDSPGITDQEREVRDKLGIDPQAPFVLILSQSSHLDWDWLETFDGYYKHHRGNNQYPVEQILTRATDILGCNPLSSSPNYYYSVAEIGFLREFLTDPRQSSKVLEKRLQKLLAAGDALRIVGGGITSPDSLLPHGETFLRNFLIGKVWLDSVGLPGFTNIWLPDDFGHDPNCR